MLPTELSGFTDSLAKLRVDPTVIDKVRKDILAVHSTITDTHFDSLHIARSAYGNSPKGAELANEHDLAHQEAAQAVNAILTDLNTFMGGFKKFVNDVNAVDTRAALTAHQRRAAIEALNTSAAFNHTKSHDHQYHLPSGQAPNTGDQS